MTTFSEACLDPNLLGPWFEGPTWATWRVVDKALFGEPLSPDELKVWQELSGTDCSPQVAVREAWLCFGRRSGKDVKAAALVTYLATVGAELFSTRQRLSRGERGVVQLLAVDRDQAGVCMNYARAMFEQPLLASMLDGEPTRDTISLTNGIAIEITTSDRRRVRGRTVVAAVFDEVAHWRSAETSSPDEDTYAAVRPAMSTIPTSMLVAISTPYARRGLFWKKFRQLHAQPPGRAVFLKAPTWRMNLTLPRTCPEIDESYQDDESSASAEWGAEFRSDLESYISREVVDSCVDPTVYERAPMPSPIRYCAFVDPAGGSGQDSMTLAIAHRAKDDDGAVILDAIREWRPPFSPKEVVAEAAVLLRNYSIKRIVGDHYAGEFAREPFARLGITYEPAARPKTEIYRDTLPLLTSGRAALLDHNRLVQQLVALERRTGRSGRDAISHPPGGHDDVANAALGALAAAAAMTPGHRYTEALLGGAL